MLTTYWVSSPRSPKKYGNGTIEDRQNIIGGALVGFLIYLTIVRYSFGNFLP